MTILRANTEENKATILAWYRMGLTVYNCNIRDGNTQPSIIYNQHPAEHFIKKCKWPLSDTYYTLIPLEEVQSP